MVKHTPDEFISKLSSLLNKNKDSPVIRMTLSRSSHFLTKSIRLPNYAIKKSGYIFRQSLRLRSLGQNLRAVVLT